MAGDTANWGYSWILSQLTEILIWHLFLTAHRSFSLEYYSAFWSIHVKWCQSQRISRNLICLCNEWLAVLSSIALPAIECWGVGSGERQTWCKNVSYICRARSRPRLGHIIANWRLILIICGTFRTFTKQMSSTATSFKDIPFYHPLCWKRQFGIFLKSSSPLNDSSSLHFRIRAPLGVTIPLQQVTA